MIEGLQLTHKDHSWTYYGRRAPSVTQALARYNDLNFVDPRVLEASSEFGRHVHLGVHLYNMGTLNYATLDGYLVPYIRGWEKFLDDAGATVLHSETRIYSKRLNYAGIVDTICCFNDRETDALVDVKTGTSVPKTVGPQTAGYAHAYKEMNGGRLLRRYCVHLKQDHYSLHRLNDPQDWDIFKAALLLHQWDGKEFT